MGPQSADPHQVLLEAIKKQITRIDELREAFNRAEEDGVYR
jgi:DNA-directed RNA polymerase subunit L